MKNKEVLYRGQKYKVLSSREEIIGNNRVTFLVLNNKKYKMTVNAKYVIYC